jgi:hypothetical protein
MPRGKKKDFIQRAKEKGGSDLFPSVNGERVLKELEKETPRSYQQKLNQ